MNEILKNKPLRRRFFIGSGLTISILVITRLFIYYYSFNNPEIENNFLTFIATFIERLLVTFLTTTAIGYFIFIETPKVDPKEGAEFLHSSQINTYFTSVLKKEPTEWFYKGGIGTFLRYVIIPHLLRISEEKKSPVLIKAQIPNPENDLLCELQARVRFKKTNNGTTTWTAKEVKLNLYATIISCSIYEGNNEFININLHLTDFYSINKIDINTYSGIITKDDFQSYGLTFKEGTTHYNSWKAELMIAEKQGTEYKFSSDVSRKLNDNYKIEDLKAEDIKIIMTELNFNEQLSNSDYKKIAKLVSARPTTVSEYL